MIKPKPYQSLFCPPRFLEMSAAGLDISDRFIRFVEYRKSPFGYVLHRFAKRDVPQGVFVGGEIADKKALAGILSDLKKEFGLRFVKVALPEEKSYVFKLRLPHAAAADMAQAVEFKIEENVPLQASEVLFDYHVIKDNLGHAEFDVGVSVVPAALVNSYCEVLSAAGLVPVSFQVETVSAARAVVPAKDNGAYVVVHVHNHGTVISIVSRGIVQFTTTFPVGGKRITEIIAKELSLSFADAEKKKIELCSKESKEFLELFSVMANSVSAIKDEVDRAYAYWQTHIETSREDEPIKKILLCGRDTAIAGFEKSFTLNFNVDIDVANVWTNAFSLEDYVPEIHFIDSLDYAVAAGIALS